MEPTLPPDILYEIFIRSVGEEVFSLILSSSFFADVANREGFWRRKFYEEKIPLLEIGYDRVSWLDIYTRIKWFLEKARSNVEIYGYHCKTIITDKKDLSNFDLSVKMIGNDGKEIKTIVPYNMRKYLSILLFLLLPDPLEISINIICKDGEYLIIPIYDDQASWEGMKFSVEKEDIIKLLFTLYYKEVYTEDCPGCHHCS